MQKHERQCLGLAKELLEPRGFRVRHYHNGNTKMVITASWMNGLQERQASYIVASSPRVRDDLLHYVRQWAKKVDRV